MDLSELNNLLDGLVSDAFSSVSPIVDDARTQETLNSIHAYIRRGFYSLNEFKDFISEHIHGEFGQELIDEMEKRV